MELTNKKREREYQMYMELHFLEPNEVKRIIESYDITTLKRISNGGCIPIVSKSRKVLIDNIVTTIANRKRIRER